MWKRRLKRATWLRVFTETVEPGCEVGMEACAGAHHWARELEARGYRVKLIAPQFVKPYVKSQKDDARDAAAICEAMSREEMRFVAVKTIEQQDIQAFHRVRSLVMSERNAKANQIRGLVAEYGVVAPAQVGPLRAAIPCWLEDAENGLTDRFRALLHPLWRELLRLDERVKVLDREIKVLSDTHPEAKRLKQLRGIGPLTATALVARIGDGRAFSRGRQAAACVGLTPRHHGTGGKNRLYGITKQGDRYFEKHPHPRGSSGGLSGQSPRRSPQCLGDRAQGTLPHQCGRGGLANKNVRIAWAMLRGGTDYEPKLATA